MNEEEKQELMDMLRSQIDRSEQRKKYILDNIDDFRLPDLEYVEADELPGIFFDIVAIPVDSDPTNKYEGEEHKPYVRLEWGWDAGMTEEELSRMAEDSPRGKDWLYMDLRQLERLRNSLTEILDKYKD